MKKNLLFLLLTLLAMTACQEDEIQTVAFGTEQITVGTEQQSFTVHISANCSWYINGSGDRAYVNTTSGSGDAVVEVNVFRNTSYETGQHVFTLISEDGTATSTLVVVQQPRIKMDMAVDGPVPAEGGYYNIYVKTNDNIEVSELPQWVTNVDSRALKSSTFTLECMANRSGKPRMGTVVFTGRSEEHSINIRQDSYTPDSLKLRVPESLVQGLTTYRYQIDVLPVYADWDKLHPELVSLTGGKPGTVRIEKGFILLDFPAYGEYRLSIFADGNMVFDHRLAVRPVEPVLLLGDGEDVCLGDIRTLSDDNCELRFSNTGLVQKQADGTYRFVREGRLTVTAINRHSGRSVSATVNVSRIILAVEGSRTSASGDKNRVSLTYSARCCDMTEYQFYLTDQAEPGERINQVNGQVTEPGMQTVHYSSPSVLIPATVPDPVQQVLNSYTLHFIATINGVKHHVYRNF